MDSIDETSILESTTVATEDSPSRSINTCSSSSEPHFVSEDDLHKQLQLIEEVEAAHTLSRAQYLQEEVLENPQKPVPPVIFKYILIGMGLCGILIGIVLGAIVGQHFLKQSHQSSGHMHPPSLNEDGANNTTSHHTPSPAAPSLVWYYPPTPVPSSDIFEHAPTSMRTAYPTATAYNSSNTLKPTSNSSTFQNETTSFNETAEEDSDVDLNETNVILP